MKHIPVKIALKIEGCHNANFAFTGGIKMITVGFLRQKVKLCFDLLLMCHHVLVNSYDLSPNIFQCCFAGTGKIVRFAPGPTK